MSGFEKIKNIMALGLLLISSCSGGHEGGDGGTPADGGNIPVSETVPLYGRFETTLDGLATDGNPFDPGLIDVVGEFTAPDGVKYSIPAFAYQGFSRALIQGAENLTAAGDVVWKIRFAPAKPGVWTWRWAVKGGAAGPLKAFEAVAPEKGVHGFLRRIPNDWRHIRFDDGASFTAVGENLCWYDGRGTYAYDDWLAKLKARGVNYIRLWMPAWAFGLEGIERDEKGAVKVSSLGDYRSRMNRAWQLDYVIESAERLGIAVMLCIQNHGQFSLRSNSEWADCPYNKVNGGPLEQPGDFFTDTVAKTLFQRRLRYIVARWGYSRSILAWELFNEVDLTAQTDPDIVSAWHKEMAEYLKGLDPFGHMVTTSTTGILSSINGLDDKLFRMNAMDLAQFHMYGEYDFTVEVPRRIALLAKWKKPVLGGEIGVNTDGAGTLEADPEFAGLNDLIWAGLFGGGFGVGITWWWDIVIDARDLYCRFDVVAKALEGVAPSQYESADGNARVESGGTPRTLAAYALMGPGFALIWAKDKDALWYNKAPVTPVENAVLKLQGLEAGVWTVRWLDPYCGPEQSGGTVTSTGAETSIPVPVFKRDTILRLDRAASR
ncbi:MAG: DUF5060 domain-containing protein [Myxococcota bacterium]|jgi:hypothetical protein